LLGAGPPQLDALDFHFAREEKVYGRQWWWRECRRRRVLVIFVIIVVAALFVFGGRFLGGTKKVECERDHAVTVGVQTECS